MSGGTPGPLPWMLRSRRTAALTAALGLVAGVLLATLYLVDPSRSALYPPCLFHLLTDLWCPGCGGTRALHALLHGNLAAALRFNLMVTVGVLGAPILALAAWRHPRIVASLTRPATLALALVAALAFGVLRNLDAAPFRLLAPP